MPKQTFYNLPEEKRRIIEEAAVAEFGERGFEAASISQIVSRAAIAKGSFYQYFEDKRDLFLHLVERVSQEKAAFFAGHMPPDPRMDFFATLRYMFEQGYAYAAVQSPLNRAVTRVLFGEGLFLDKSFQEMRESSTRILSGMVEQAIQRGDIDPSVDPLVAAFTIETLLNGLGMFILRQQPAAQAGAMQGSLDWLSSSTAQRIVDNLLHMLENGLRNKNHAV